MTNVMPNEMVTIRVQLSDSRLPDDILSYNHSLSASEWDHMRKRYEVPPQTTDDRADHVALMMYQENMKDVQQIVEIIAKHIAWAIRKGLVQDGK